MIKTIFYKRMGSDTVLEMDVPIGDLVSNEEGRLWNHIRTYINMKDTSDDQQPISHWKYEGELEWNDAAEFALGGSPEEAKGKVFGSLRA